MTRKQAVLDYRVDGVYQHLMATVFDRVEALPQDMMYFPVTPQSDQSDRYAITAPSMTESAERRLRELHLLHLWTIGAAPTIPGTYEREVKHTWVVDVPRLALTYPPLLDAMMAFSILYTIRTMSPTQYDKQQLLADRANYLEATLQEHRKAMETLSAGTADAASLASSLICFDSFASLQDRPLEPYQPPGDWLCLCKGVMQVFRVAMEHVHNDPNSKIIKIAEASAQFTAPSSIFNAANRAKFAHLLPQVDGTETDTEEDIEVYERTLDFIGAVMNAHEAGANSGRIYRQLMVYAILFPTRFVDRVNAKRPKALVVLAQFFGLLSLSTDAWLVGSTPRREVEAIDRFVGPKWAHLMEWPLKMVRKNVSL